MISKSRTDIRPTRLHSYKYVPTGRDRSFRCTGRQMILIESVVKCGYIIEYIEDVEF